jgi:hydrogenase maturation protease
MRARWRQGSRRAPPRILVAGLGNLLLRDDGVGVHTARALAEWRSPRVVVAEVGTAVFDALHLLEWADAVVAIDGLLGCGAPGTVYRCQVDQLAMPEPTRTLHEVGLRGALGMLRSEVRPPVTVIGVEPRDVDYGLELSQPVQAALPMVIEAVRAEVATWRRTLLAARPPLVTSSRGGAGSLQGL